MLALLLRNPIASLLAAALLAVGIWGTTQKLYADHLKQELSTTVEEYAQYRASCQAAQVKWESNVATLTASLTKQNSAVDALSVKSASITKDLQHTSTTNAILTQERDVLLAAIQAGDTSKLTCEQNIQRVLDLSRRITWGTTK